MKENKNVDKKVNVLQLVEGFSLGGAEKKLLELVQHFDKDKFNTTVCSLNLGSEIQNEFEKLRSTGIDVEIIPRKWRLDFGLLFWLARFMKEKKIDVVMTTLFYADVIGAIAARMAGISAVFSWETISAPEWLIKRRLWPYQFAMRYCKRVVAVSKATADFLINDRGVQAEKVTIIPYGVDLDIFNTLQSENLKTELGLENGTTIVGMVGRLHPQKGHIYLIQAVEEIIKTKQDVKFVLAGDGPQRSLLESEVKSRKLNNYIEFLGFRHDIPVLLKSFDIFVLPSLYEGLPNVVLEAMASGKPVVATPVDGTKEAVVDGETGILVPQEDPQQLSQALLKLINDRELALIMGQAGRKRVENYFSLDMQVQKFQDLYLEHLK